MSNTLPNRKRFAFYKFNGGIFISTKKIELRLSRKDFKLLSFRWMTIKIQWVISPYQIALWRFNSKRYLETHYPVFSINPLEKLKHKGSPVSQIATDDSEVEE